MRFLGRITDRQVTGEDLGLVSRISRYGSRGVVINDQGKIALMYLRKLSIYKLPGGGILPGESKEAAFIREVREETGFPVEILAEIGTIEEHKAQNHYLQLSYCFVGRVSGEAIGNDLSANERRLGFELRWFTPKQASFRMRKNQCVDYTMKYILLRDRVVLREGLYWLKQNPQPLPGKKAAEEPKSKS
ncbi:MAG: NUDIX domain-containing protein [Negativicutes bacterium]|nr:NUDIX domain-containing protein [Negativicutes bacterium]